MTTTGEKTQVNFRVYRAGEVMDMPSPGWLIHGILPSRALATVYGPSGHGKTHVVLSMARAVSSGEKWLGQYEVTKGPVLYIAAEGGGELGKRLVAQGFAHDDENALFVLEPLFLGESGDREWLLEAIRRQEFPRPRLAIFDTLSMNFAGEENSATDMNELIRAASQVRNGTGATVLFVHHTGKGKACDANATERGSTALRSGMETSIYLARCGGVMQLRNPKQKDASPFLPIGLQLVPSEGSVTVEVASTRSGVDSANTLRPNLRRALEVLSAAPNGFRSGEWQAALGMSNGAFQNLRKQLVALSYVEFRDDRYLPTATGHAAIPPTSPKAIAA
jgi:hypothetical protein